MAVFTMELREIIEHYSQYNDDLTTDERIEIGRQKLFDFHYPFFSEEYRKEFETHFIRHFYFREIGMETEGSFKFHLKTWLSINMPYFNKLFESEQFDFDPFISYDLLTTYERDLEKQESITNESTGSTTAQNDGETTQTGSNESSHTQRVEGENNATRTNADTINTDTTTTGETTSSNQAETETTTTANGTTDQFDRELTADTPDNRLQIAYEEPTQSVIEYATQIKENQNTNATTNSETNNQSTTGSTTQNDSQSVGTSTTENREQTESQDTLQNTTGSETSSGNVNTTTSETTAINQSNTGNQQNEGDEKETYTENKRGSIGVKTYSEMLQEYRETFIRVEVDIFNEMGRHLFMLIY